MDESEERETPPLPIYWRDVPTITVDGLIGSARAGGLHRIVLGEVVFNTDPGAERPALRPVCNVVMTPMAVESLIVQLQHLLTEASADAQP